MLYYLSQYIQERAAGTEWADPFSFLRVFRYITFRSAGAAVTALALSWWLGPRVIDWLKKLKFGQHYPDKAEEAGGMAARLLSKRGTPTMGGVLIVTAMDLSALLWAQWNELVLLTLLSLVVLSGLGFYDDYAKIALQNSRGAKSYLKLAVQTLLALFIGLYLWMLPSTSELITELMVPFYKYPVLTGAGAIGLLVTMLTIVAGNIRFATYLQVPYVPGAGELAVFCGAMIGAGLGFLWFNCHPAQMFMGDTGSLALGGALGILAVLIHQPFVLLIAGGVFVAEAVSVVCQTGYFKYTKRKYGAGRRIFLMAPLHHHFEKKGWYESQVVTRFYILCVLCAVVALSTLKLR
jgi:phospho-N-acetylmuramoyl-pentapeptide-transferase